MTRRFYTMMLLLIMTLMLAVTGCKAINSPTAAAICQNALVKQAVVITAALVRNIPVERYVDGMCQIASIVEPFIKDPLKPTILGGATPDPIQQSLAAARIEGLVE